MFLGKIFAFAWQGADLAAQGAAGAIATGAKVVGQIPVVMAHMENAVEGAAVSTYEAADRARIVATKDVAVTASDWVASMNVGSAEVLSTVGFSDDPAAIQSAGDKRTKDIRRGFEDQEEQADEDHLALDRIVAQDSSERLDSAQNLSAAVESFGAGIGEGIEGGVAAAGGFITGVLKTIDGMMVDALVDTVGGVLKGAGAVVGAVKKAFAAVKSLFSKAKVADPVLDCPPKPNPRQELFDKISEEKKLIAEAKAQGLGDTPEVKALEAQVDASTKLLMSGDMYNEHPDFNSEVAPGWKRVNDDDIRALGLDPNQFHPEDSEFRAGLYKSDDDPPKYTMAFKGTTADSESDWKNNFRQGLGLKSDYYERAKALATAASDTDAKGFDVTGHSLGGGLAAAAASVTGAHGVTYNAAALNPATVDHYDEAALNGQLTNYHIDGEVLTTAQGYVGQHAAGRGVLLPADKSEGMIDRHSIDSLATSMKGVSKDVDEKVEQMVTPVTHGP